MKALFVCAGNTCRSPMAQALFEEFVKGKGENISADSAGICARGATSKHAIAALSECGIDFPARRAKQIDKVVLDEADVVFAMTKAQAAALSQIFGNADKIRAISDVAGYDVPDPYGKGLGTYRECCSRLRLAMPKIYEFVKRFA